MERNFKVPKYNYYCTQLASLYTMRSCNQTGLYYLEVHIFESSSLSNSENLQHYIKQGVFVSNL
jgi:hypothetical protein